MPDIASAFQNADGAMQDALAHCLDFMNELPFFRNYKRQTWEALKIAPGNKILDAACGLGYDVIEMSRLFPDSEFCGVDISDGFLAIARSRAKGVRNAKFIRGNLKHIDFANNEFDGGRIDRSLQHIDSPIDAVRELVRVTRAGGRIVISEPDWGTFFVHNGDFETGSKMAGLWRGSFVNPYIGREAGDLLAECGVADIKCRVHPLVVTTLETADVIFDLARVKDNCVTAGVLSVVEAHNWWRASEIASRRGTFLACLNIIQYDGATCK